MIEFYNIFLSILIPFSIGLIIGNRINNHDYHKCLYCKHYCIQGKPSYVNIIRGYCMHPDNADVSPLDPVPDNHYCGKFEVSEAYKLELSKIELEKTYNKSFKLTKNERR